LIVEPGESVWMEDPGYPGARQMIAGAGARVVDVPVDDQGMIVSEGVRQAKTARLAYVTPCRQAPTGVALSPHRREELLLWASANQSYIFEDDYDSEYRFIAKPIPALKGLPNADNNVILAGTFSKLLFPAIGLAYVALPRELVSAFTRALSLTARHANGLAQAVLADFMTEGQFGRHIRKMRKIYASRAKIFEDMAAVHWKDIITIPPIAAGLDIVGRLNSLLEADTIHKLRAVGIGPLPLSQYANSTQTKGLVMGFAGHTEEQIEQGIIKVHEVLRQQQ
jgi:GntR family transcriptional regulator/MocR family aminotransferase